MTKLTNKAALESAIFALTYLTQHGENASIHFPNSEITEKLNGMIAQLDKRAAAPKAPTKAQRENADLAEIVRDVLAAAGQPLTITEIMRGDERLAALSNQKVTAVVRSMGEAIAKVPDKRVNRFTLA